MLDTQDIKQRLAPALGFSACGVVPLSQVDADTEQYYKRWLEARGHADMQYLENYMDKRMNPQLLVEGSRSMMCLAMSYVPSPDHALSTDGYDFARYALGKDYHDVMKERLRMLATDLGLTNYRVFVDTAPIMERYWAWRAGLGWIGRNHQLIIPDRGSMFFLGEIICDEEFSEYDEPIKGLCGECHKCEEACPTGALCGMFDASLCLSYQTIENRGPIPETLNLAMGECIYGCDRCQLCCPHNKHAVPTTVREFMPSEAMMQMTRDDWHNLSIEEYRRLFKGSAVKRAKYEGLMRNIDAVKGE